MGRTFGSINQTGLDVRLNAIGNSKNMKHKYWVSASDYQLYCDEHKGNEKRIFNRNYTMSPSGRAVGLVKVTKEIFNDMQKWRNEKCGCDRKLTPQDFV